MDFGEWGVWTSFRQVDEDEAGEAARVAEDAGYGTFWLGGSPRLAQVRRLLEGSEKLVVGTSIVNIWAYDPEDLAREFHELALSRRRQLDADAGRKGADAVIGRGEDDRRGERGLRVVKDDLT